MTRFGWMVFSGIVVVLLVIGTVFVFFHMRAVPVAVTPTETDTAPVTDPSSLSIYTNGEYGFSFFYPADGVVTDAFASSAAAAPTWRTQAAGKGMAIVRIQSKQGVIQVGESTDAREVKSCFGAGPAEEVQQPLTIGSTTWQHFSFDKMGTDNPQRVTSYRTLRKNMCIAFEILQPRSAEASTTIYSLEKSITSFTFAQ